MGVCREGKVDLTKKIGLRLHDVRNGQRVSLAALASRTGDTLSKSRISYYEQGLRRMGIEEAHRGTGNGTPGPSPPDRETTHRGRDILAARAAHAEELRGLVKSLQAGQGVGGAAVKPKATKRRRAQPEG